MKFKIKYGLPFVEAMLIHNGKKVYLSNVLVDTGSASTIISANDAIKLGLKPEPDDKIRSIRGIGGTEFVYEKYIDGIRLGSIVISNFKVQVGAMDYGFGISAIIGMDFLISSKVVIDMRKMILY